MADRRSWEGGGGLPDDVGAGGRNMKLPAPGGGEQAAQLTVSGSFKGEGAKVGGSRRRASMKPSSEVDDLINLLHGSDPIRVELSRLENEVRGRIVIRIHRRSFFLEFVGVLSHEY